MFQVCKKGFMEPFFHLVGYDVFLGFVPGPQHAHEEGQFALARDRSSSNEEAGGFERCLECLVHTKLK